MSIGSTQQVLVCIPVESASSAQRMFCPPDDNGQQYAPQKTQAYLMDAAQQSGIEAALGPFDYAYAGGLWALAFSTVVGLYFVSHSIGLVLGFIRRG